MNILIKYRQNGIWRNLLTNNSRCYHKKGVSKNKRRDETIHAPQLAKAPILYGFGLSATGSLGNAEYLLPKNGNALSAREHVSLPARIKYFTRNNLEVKNYACGYGFSAFICKKHGKQSVYGCGLNTDGQLGIHSESLKGELHDGQLIEVIPEPLRIDLDNLNPSPLKHRVEARLVSCGRAHMLIACELVAKADDVANSSMLVSLGNNVFGQGGRHIIEGELFSANHAVISRLLLPDPHIQIKQVLCGQDHSLILSADGRVFACGLSSDGQTGLGSLKSVDQFTRVDGALSGVRIVELSGRGDTTLALSDCGRVFAWGNNEYGQVWTMNDQMQVTTPVELPLCTKSVRLSPETGYSDYSDFELGRLTSLACAGSMCGALDSHGHVSFARHASPE